MAIIIPKVGERRVAPTIKPFVPPPRRVVAPVSASAFQAKTLLQRAAEQDDGMTVEEIEKSLLDDPGLAFGYKEPSRLQSAKAKLNLIAPKVVMPKWQGKGTGLTLNLPALLEKYPLPPTPDGQVFTLHDWQIEDIASLIQWDRVGVFLPVGAGKTVIATLVALAWGDDLRVVVLPPILVKQWVRWLNSVDPAGNAVAYKGSIKDRAAIDLTKSQWWVMSYGIFKNDFERISHTARSKRVALIVDEWQNAKSARSKIFVACERFSAGQRLIGMTGTELNSPADAYAPIRIKTPGVYNSYGQFERIHVGKRDFFDKPVQWVNLDLMNENLYLQSVQRSKDDVHGHLPTPRYMPLEYDLDPKHQKLYTKLVDEQLLVMEDGGKIDATTAQNLYNYSQQLVLNWSKFAGESGLRPAAFDIIDTLIEQTNFGTPKGPKKFIVWTWFQESNEVVSDYLKSLYPGRVVQAYGKSDSQKAVDSFMEDPECWWLVANPGSAGAGLNPQYICYNCLFLEIPTRTIQFRQSAGRIDREGQKENANIWLAIASNTIQQHLYKNLLTNDELVQKVQGNPSDLRKIIHGE